MGEKLWHAISQTGPSGYSHLLCTRRQYPWDVLGVCSRCRIHFRTVVFFLLADRRRAFSGLVDSRLPIKKCDISRDDNNHLVDQNLVAKFFEGKWPIMSCIRNSFLSLLQMFNLQWPICRTVTTTTALFQLKAQPQTTILRLKYFGYLWSI